MKGFILAAGFGTRLQPITFTLPKPMAPVCNRPLIAWAVESFLAAGVHELIVNLHHLPEPLQEYLRREYAGRADFHFSIEEEILGTGGGIRRIEPQLANEEEFFVVNGDTIQFPPWNALREARRAKNALAALTLRHPPEGDKFTPVYFDDGIVTGFGSGSGEPLMFSGSHVISTRIFEHIPGRPFSGIVEHAYQPAMAQGERLAGVVDDGLWFDIGTPQRYMTASRTLLDLMLRGQLAIPSETRIDADSLVHDTAKVSGTISRSIAGERSVIEGALTDTVVWDDCRIASGAKLDGCVVAHGVEIANAIELRNVLICRDEDAIPRDGEHRFEYGFVLRDI